MTYRAGRSIPEELLKQIIANGFAHLLELLSIVVNAAIRQNNNNISS